MIKVCLLATRRELIQGYGFYSFILHLPPFSPMFFQEGIEFSLE